MKSNPYEWSVNRGSMGRAGHHSELSEDGGVVIWIDPKDFLLSADYLPSFFKRIDSINYARERWNECLPVAIPFLYFKKKGKFWECVGHEGRHRATVAIENNAKIIPVLIVLIDDEGTISTNEITDSLVLSLNGYQSTQKSAEHDLVRISFDKYWLNGTLHSGQKTQRCTIEAALTAFNQKSLQINPMKLPADIGPADRDNGIYISLKSGRFGGRVAEIKAYKSDHVVGTIVIERNDNGNYSLHSYADRGFGPLLYEIAIELNSVFNLWTRSGTHGVSPAAARLWDRFLARDDLVKKSDPVYKPSYKKGKNELEWEASTEIQLSDSPSDYEGLKFAYQKPPNLILSDSVMISGVDENAYTGVAFSWMPASEFLRGRKIKRNPDREITKHDFISVSDDPEKWRLKSMYFDRNSVKHLFDKSDVSYFLQSDKYDKNCHTIVAVTGSKVVATGHFSTDFQPLEVAIEVDPNYRRRKIASTIYETVEEITGMTVHPAASHTPYAEAFWKQPDRKFGVKKNPPSPNFNFLGAGSFARVFTNGPLVEIILEPFLKPMDEKLPFKKYDHCRYKMYDMSREAMIYARQIATDNLKKHLPEITRKRLDKNYSGEIEFIYESTYSEPWHHSEAKSYKYPSKRAMQSLLKTAVKHIYDKANISRKFEYRFARLDYDKSENLGIVNGIVIYRDPIACEFFAEEAIELFAGNFKESKVRKNPPSQGFDYLGSGNYSRIYKNKDRVEAIVGYKDPCRSTPFPHYDASREIMISVRELAPLNIKKFLPEIVRKRIDTDKDCNLEFIYEMPLYKDNYSVNDDESDYIKKMIPNVEDVVKPTSKELQKISSMIIEEVQKYPKALFRFDSDGESDPENGTIEWIVPYNLSVYNGVLILRDPIVVAMNSDEFVRTFSANFNRKSYLARYLFSATQE